MFILACILFRDTALFFSSLSIACHKYTLPTSICSNMHIKKTKCIFSGVYFNNYTFIAESTPVTGSDVLPYVYIFTPCRKCQP